jgi:Fic family protein
LGVTILARRQEYYKALEAANKHNEVTEWLAWMAGVSIEAQLRTTARVHFLIEQTKLLDSMKEQLNARQMKVLLRVLKEGPQGFQGGLSAGNYAMIAQSSPATTTRDLAELVGLGALTRSGEKKHTRYALNVPMRKLPRIEIDGRGRVVESEVIR